jgi:hypothetical protein
MNRRAQVETLFCRQQELRKLLLAIQKRESQLVWGPADSGKSALVNAVMDELPEEERRSCLSWAGPATTKQLLAYLVGRLYELGHATVQRKVHTDGERRASLGRWLGKQTSLWLRGILLTALTGSGYRLFLDHFPPATHKMARLMKDIMYRCRTPIYLAARGYSQKEIGYAWSLYWNDRLRLHVGPLAEPSARNLLDACIGALSLDSFDFDEVREEILRLSGLMPGAIVKMCELAAASRYRDGGRIKIKLLYVDYLMQRNRAAFLNLLP